MNKKCIFLAVLITAAFSAAFATAAQTPESFSSLAQKLKPSVVNIATTSTIKGSGDFFRFGERPDSRDPFGDFFEDDFFRRFFGEDAPHPDIQSQSLGSGFILDKEGYVLTNNHVVENADKILVRLSDEHEFPAKIVGTDPMTDLAVIRIEPMGVSLSPVEMGDSDEARIGDWVVAIGNPFGYGHTVTAGIVSAKGRVIGAGPYDNFLQTDAAINPGNSGGPLFDMQGRVIGINTAIVAGGTGMGFAIPVNLAKEVVGQLKDKGRVTRGWLGVMIQDVTPELAKQFDLEEAKGALVSEVAAGGPAEKGGVERGDVILAFDGVPVDKMHQLPRLVAQRKPEKEVKVKVLRKGKEKTLTVVLGELQEEGGAISRRKEAEGDLGLTVQEITPQLRKQLGLGKEGDLIVSDVEPGSNAAQAGIRRGDVVLEINQSKVSDLSSYRKALDNASDKKSALLLVKRGDVSIYIIVQFPK